MEELCEYDDGGGGDEHHHQDTVSAAAATKYCFFVVLTSLWTERTFPRIYHVVWFTVGTFVPFTALLVTGTVLAKAARARRRASNSATSPPGSTVTVRHHRGATAGGAECGGTLTLAAPTVYCCCRRRALSPITATVIATVASFSILVCPSIIVESVRLIAGVGNFSPTQYDLFRTVIILTNLSQVKTVLITS